MWGGEVAGEAQGTTVAGILGVARSERRGLSGRLMVQESTGHTVTYAASQGAWVTSQAQPLQTKRWKGDEGKSFVW